MDRTNCSLSNLVFASQYENDCIDTRFLPSEIREGLKSGDIRRVPLNISTKFTLPRGSYFVTRNGEVLSMNFSITKNMVEWITMHPTKQDGYLIVQLWYKGDMQDVRVHRLIVISFLNKIIPPSLEVMHMDHNPSNNSVSNLSVGTSSENKLSGCSGEVTRAKGYTRLDLMTDVPPDYLDFQKYEYIQHPSIGRLFFCVETGVCL